MKDKQKTKSVFRIIVSALLIVLVTEVLLMVGSILFSGVNERLDNNAIDILEKQVENRKGYLENEMLDNWSNLSFLVDDINETVKMMRDAGTIDINSLDSSSESCVPLLQEIGGRLITALYNRQATGIFVVFNTRDLDKENSGVSKPGIYIRDLDPMSAPSSRYGDLLLERAPKELSHFLDISMDSGWRPAFRFTSKEENAFFYHPFQAALKDGAKEEAKEYGYWTTSSYMLEGDSLPAVSYSVPLMLEDGTVYGVLGVEILTRYLKTGLPYEELQDNSQGTYVLGSVKNWEAEEKFLDFKTTIASSGPFFKKSSEGNTFRIKKIKQGYLLKDGSTNYYAAVQPLSLYSRNGPFSEEQWMLVGLVQTKHLFAFSRQVFMTLMTALMIMIVIGIVGSVIVARQISKPIKKLSGEVAAHRGKEEIPSLSYTGIRELDRFATAITELSQEVLETSTKFLRIMEMASVDLGGYEYREETDNVYVTENFFPLLGMEPVKKSELTPEKLKEVLRELHETRTHKGDMEGNRIYQIPLSKGRVRYLRLEASRIGQRHIGLVEDVTSSALERLRIEHERDYDTLTGLYSRRAFRRKSEELFAHPEKLKHTALLMMDLDNLKMINDTYGHDWGDHYIRQAGRCILDNVPVGTVCARISGDEFFVMFYGYESQKPIRKILEHLYRAVRSSVLMLPNGREMPISASGGVSWYPDDSTELSVLMKYADFAMYQIKRSYKGGMTEFDIGSYNEMEYHSQSKKEFYQLIEKELLNYHFQPIFSARDGSVVAYEALMRADLPTLHSPDAVMRMAKEEDRLHDIERLTMFKASEAFCDLREKEELKEDAFLFINSIASEYMTMEEFEEYHRMFSHVQGQIVIEITEEEFLNEKAMEAKRNAPGFSGIFALDDYGSGYNTEKNLLELSPKYIKVDISIVRNVDTDTDKQQIMANIISYAHQRGMQIIAEGLETDSELEKVMELGVDLLQGFYLARPAAVPTAMNPAAAKFISEFHASNEEIHPNTVHLNKGFSSLL
ncbi:MAG: EAL domain-containing protein [Eubacteriales bacterium]|nr:EAL domain-containing protein [Eubacteriales bacterium]